MSGGALSQLSLETLRDHHTELPLLSCVTPQSPPHADPPNAGFTPPKSLSRVELGVRSCSCRMDTRSSSNDEPGAWPGGLAPLCVPSPSPGLRLPVHFCPQCSRRAHGQGCTAPHVTLRQGHEVRGDQATRPNKCTVTAVHVNSVSRR